MQKTLIFIYYTTILFVAITAIVKYRQLDKALRSIAILLILTVISESITYLLFWLEEHKFRNVAYHILSILQLILISMFYIEAIRLKQPRQYIMLAIVVSFTIGMLNIYLYQSIFMLNSYMLMFESFAIVSMSLYYVYWLIKRGNVINMFKQPHFLISLLLLLLWSGSFFFWAFISVLYEDGWAYTTVVTNAHLIINIFVYFCMGITLFHSTRKSFNHDYKH